MYEWGLDVDYKRSAGGFGAVCKEGYGVCYIHLGEDLGILFVHNCLSFIAKIQIHFWCLLGKVICQFNTYILFQFQ